MYVMWYQKWLSTKKFYSQLEENHNDEVVTPDMVYSEQVLIWHKYNNNSQSIKWMYINWRKETNQNYKKDKQTKNK